MNFSAGVTAPVYDHTNGLEVMIHAMQLIVPDASFLAGVSSHQVFAEMPDFHEPEWEHCVKLVRPASIAEALRSAMLDNVEGGGFDPAHPPVSRLYVGELEAAVRAAHERFPSMELEFGYIDGQPFSTLRSTMMQGTFWNAALKHGESLADAVTAAVLDAEEDLAKGYRHDFHART